MPSLFRLWRLALVCCSLVLPAAAQGEISCYALRGEGGQSAIGDYTLQIERIERADPPSGRHRATEPNCRARVVSSQGRLVFKVNHPNIFLNEAAGKDLNGDGQPEIVFEGYSGGAHCCWTYWIVSLAKPAGLLRKLCNDRSGEFADLDQDGRFEFLTLDGAFDYFDEMSHASSPFPTVVLRLEGRELKRVNIEFWPIYEKDIAEAQEVSSEALRLFRTGNREVFADNPHDWETTKQRILQMVLANLYGGREAEAWRILGEYWPPADVRRIKRRSSKQRRKASTAIRIAVALVATNESVGADLQIGPLSSCDFDLKLVAQASSLCSSEDDKTATQWQCPPFRLKPKGQWVSYAA